MKKQENTLEIDFGTPNHGWLPTRLKWADFELSFDISDVPLDPMEQLCSSLIQISKGIKIPDRIVWHLEPNCYYLQLEKSEEGVKVKILTSDNFESSTKLIKEFDGSFETIILPLYRGLKKFASFSFKPPHWEEVDSDRIEELTDLIREQKSIKIGLNHS